MPDVISGNDALSFAWCTLGSGNTAGAANHAWRVNDGFVALGLATHGLSCQMLWMKWFDIPPVWLVGGLIVTYWLGQAQPFGFSLDHAITQFLGAVLIGAGLILIMLAIAEMRRKKTTWCDCGGRSPVANEVLLYWPHGNKP
ncbi:hypothetical protein [Octadecabacter antarcticus]|nr:hypothetical protein [Octadecabacter antarcticus]